MTALGYLETTGSHFSISEQGTATINQGAQLQQSAASNISLDPGASLLIGSEFTTQGGLMYLQTQAAASITGGKLTQDPGTLINLAEGAEVVFSATVELQVL